MTTDLLQSPPPTESGAGQTLALSGAITVYTVESHRDHLLEHWHTRADITVDLSGVDACDCAGLQLLCAARKSAVLSGRNLRFTRTPGFILDTAREAGIEPSEFSVTPQTI
jgi:phospholipid transport system transporter-binding protein